MATMQEDFDRLREAWLDLAAAVAQALWTPRVARGATRLGLRPRPWFQRLLDRPVPPR